MTLHLGGLIANVSHSHHIYYNYLPRLCQQVSFWNFLSFDFNIGKLHIIQIPREPILSLDQALLLI